MLDFQAARWLVKGEVAKQAGNNHPTSIPTGVFKTADGYINIASAGQKIWERFCQALGAPEWIAKPGLRDRRQRARRTATRSMPRSTSTPSTRTSADWVERFNKAGVPCGPIYAIDQVFADPQVKHLGIAQPVKGKNGNGSTLVGQPVSLSRTPSSLVAPPPAIGEHTDDVLEEFGFSAERDRQAARGRRDLIASTRDVPPQPGLDEDEDEMTQTDKMLSRKEGRVGYVIFNNPERHNAVSLEMWEATARILEDFGKDDEVRVVVLTGAGGKAFVSGADISKFEDERANEEAIARYNATVERANAAIYDFPKPTIAMIRGYCIGGGLGLALCCDLRICSDNSRFAVPAAKLGLGYGYPGLKRLVDVVGPSFAKEIFFTARQFDAEEARTMGLVNRVVPADELESYVKKYADTIGGQRAAHRRRREVHRSARR